MIRPQSEFPLLNRYKEKFPITNNTIFAYDNVIYCNYELPHDLVVHEMTHHKQQEKYGLDNWVEQYLNDNFFRLKMEVEAYRKQLDSIKDRNFRSKVRQESVSHLASDLYGNIVTVEEAQNLLR